MSDSSQVGRVVDVHQHVGPWPFPGRWGGIEENLRLMDRCGIDAAVVSSTRAVVQDMVRGNAELAADLGRDDRLYGYITLNPTVPGTRSAEHWAFFSRFFHRDADAILAELLKVANEVGRSPAQVALRWVLEKPFITAPIVGARTVEQLRDNLGCTGWKMDSEHLARLDKVSYLPPRYPESMEAGWSARREDALDMPTLD